MNPITESVTFYITGAVKLHLPLKLLLLLNWMDNIHASRLYEMEKRCVPRTDIFPMSVSFGKIMRQRRRTQAKMNHWYSKEVWFFWSIVFRVHTFITCVHITKLLLWQSTGTDYTIHTLQIANSGRENFLQGDSK